MFIRPLCVGLVASKACCSPMQPRLISFQPIMDERIRKILSQPTIRGEWISCRTTHRMIKCLNNIVEQDHRFIKKKIKPMLEFKSLETARNTICGIEIMHMVRKGQVDGIQCVISEVEVLNKILGDVA